MILKALINTISAPLIQGDLHDPKAPSLKIRFLPFLITTLAPPQHTPTSEYICIDLYALSRRSLRNFDEYEDKGHLIFLSPSRSRFRFGAENQLDSLRLVSQHTSLESNQNLEIAKKRGPTMSQTLF